MYGGAFREPILFPEESPNPQARPNHEPVIRTFHSSSISVHCTATASKKHGAFAFVTSSACPQTIEAPTPKSDIYFLPPMPEDFTKQAIQLSQLHSDTLRLSNASSGGESLPAHRKQIQESSSFSVRAGQSGPGSPRRRGSVQVLRFPHLEQK